MRKNRVFIAMIAMALVVGIAQIGIAEELLKVVELKGGVLVKIYPSTDWAAAAAGQVLNPKDSIKTQETGGVVLEFPDKSSMTLKQDSELSVEDLLWTPAELKVSLILSTGQLRTILQKLGPKSEFKVKTPSAVCGARGSIFYIIVIGMLTRLFVEDGLMQFINNVSGNLRMWAPACRPTQATTEPFHRRPKLRTMTRIRSPRDGTRGWLPSPMPSRKAVAEKIPMRSRRREDARPDCDMRGCSEEGSRHNGIVESRVRFSSAPPISVF